MPKDNFFRRITSVILVVGIMFYSTTMLRATVLVESGDNKLIPYSTSNLSFKIDVAHVKSADSNIISIKQLNCTLQVVPEANAANQSIEFQRNGINLRALGGVLSKASKDPITNKVLYTYDTIMSKDCTITTTANEIKFTFSGESDLNDPLTDFMLTAYIATNGAYKDGVEQAVDVYKRNFVDTNSKLKFIVKDINVVTIYQETKMHPQTGVEMPSIPFEKTIQLNQGLIEAIYSETPLIS